MTRLDYKVLNAVGNCALKSLIHVVDHFAVSCLDMVDDDLSCESTSYRPFLTKFLIKGIFNSLDVVNTAVVEAGTK